MRYVMVLHESESDFVVGIPDDVDDPDMYLNNILHGAMGWSEPFNSIREAVEWRKGMVK